MENPNPHNRQTQCHPEWPTEERLYRRVYGYWMMNLPTHPSIKPEHIRATQGDTLPSNEPTSLSERISHIDL